MGRHSNNLSKSKDIVSIQALADCNDALKSTSKQLTPDVHKSFKENQRTVLEYIKYKGIPVTSVLDKLRIQMLRPQHTRYIKYLETALKEGKV